MVKHEVYVATNDKGEVLYIGQGRIGRSQHCNSGVSHVYELNRMHFSGEVINVEVVRSGLDKKEAEKAELKLIQDLRPSLNVVHTDLAYKGRLMQAQEAIMFNKYVRLFLSDFKSYSDQNTEMRTYDETIAKYPLKCFLSRDGVLMSKKDRYHALNTTKQRAGKGKYKKLSKIFELCGVQRLRIRQDFIDSFDEWYKEKYEK